MKIFILFSLLCLFTLASFNFYNPYFNTLAPTGSIHAFQQVSLTGAYEQINGSITGIKIFSDNYFMIAYYDLAGKKFIKASGRTYTFSKGKLTELLESSSDSTKLGKTLTYNLKRSKNDQLYLSEPITKNEEAWIWIETPDKISVLAGDWRIRGREQNGKIVAMPQGTRKTIKILSGSRFQWAAFNTATKQFSGTGGGTYKASDGKYTETVEFFSRDSSRIGMSLSFNYQIEGKDWHHTGLSSTGNKINETWTKE